MFRPHRLLAALVLLLLVRPLSADDVTKVGSADKPVPENVADLKALQDRVKTVLKKVVPCTVGLQVGGASGSGVIIDKEGHILTAGHVSGAANRKCRVIMPDGKVLSGITLGANNGVDRGLIKITDKGEFPHAEMGKSDGLKKGQWVLSTGHPGGFRPGRTPVVRLGRIQSASSFLVSTDCTLVGGDSGGPLWDLDGKVVGIHSRIGGPITANIHVPVDVYQRDWERLAKAEVWGGRFFGGAPAGNAYLGVEVDPDAADCKVVKITEGSPAEKAGLKPDDVIVKFDGKAVKSFDDLRDYISKKKVGDKVAVEVLRDKETVKVEVALAKRPE